MKRIAAIVLALSALTAIGCVTDQQKREAFTALDQTNAQLRAVAEELKAVKDSDKASAEQVREIGEKVEKVADGVEAVKEIAKPILEATTKEEAGRAVGKALQDSSGLLPPGWDVVAAGVGALLVGVFAEKRKKDAEDKAWDEATEKAKELIANGENK